MNKSACAKPKKHSFAIHYDTVDLNNLPYEDDYIVVKAQNEKEAKALLAKLLKKSVDKLLKTIKPSQFKCVCPGLPEYDSCASGYWSFVKPGKVCADCIQNDKEITEEIKKDELCAKTSKKR